MRSPSSSTEAREKFASFLEKYKTLSTALSKIEATFRQSEGNSHAYWPKILGFVIPKLYKDSQSHYPIIPEPTKKMIIPIMKFPVKNEMIPNVATTKPMTFKMPHSVD
jgi:hypothetical protein